MADSTGELDGKATRRGPVKVLLVEPEYHDEAAKHVERLRRRDRDRDDRNRNTGADHA